MAYWQLNVYVSHQKSDTRNLCACYLKLVKGEQSLSTLLGTLKYTVHFPGILMTTQVHVLMTCGRISSIDFFNG